MEKSSASPSLPELLRFIPFRNKIRQSPSGIAKPCINNVFKFQLYHLLLGLALKAISGVDIMISTHILFLVGIDLYLASPLMVRPSDWTFAELLSELLNYRRQSSGSLSKGQETHSIDDILSNLHGSQSEDKDCFICVVVHNIDGPALRDPDSQQTLSQLASC